MTNGGTKKKQRTHHPRIHKGIALMEIVVFASLLAIVFIALFNVGVIALSAVSESHKKTQAAFLLEEGVEAVKFLRVGSWSNMPTFFIATDKCLTFNGSTYVLSVPAPNCAKIDGTFERVVHFWWVYRDENNDLAPLGSGSLDSGTLLVIVEVKWEGRQGTKTESVQFYVTNLFGVGLGS